MSADRNDSNLLSDELVLINVGVEVFSRSLADQGVRVVHVNWCPPAGGNTTVINLLDRLSGRSTTE